MAQDPTPRGANPEGQAAAPPVVVKKYANRRLYNTEASSYVTLEDLAAMVREGRDFVVYDAKSGEDITRGVLTQIIVEEESKGHNLLPTPFLRQLIGFYGDNLQSLVPRYLEFAMGSFARQQEQMRRTMEQTIAPMGGFMPFQGLEEMGRQNMAMLERAMSLFSPFRPRDSEPAARDDRSVEALRAENEMLRRQIEALRAGLGRPDEPGAA
jgi:polyhydroxyalkanoate synthesis repressor PhaR